MTTAEGDPATAGSEGMPADRDRTVPRVRDLTWPTLCALQTLGREATNAEIYEEVVRREGYSETQQSALHKDGPQTMIDYRLGWTRTVLRFGGLIDSSRAGRWTITELGAGARQEDMQALQRRYNDERRGNGPRRRGSGNSPVNDATQVSAPEEPPEAQDGEPDWRTVLLETLFAMKPDAFERLAERLLRAAGFVNTQVTGKSGDGGIDGVGVYRLSLLSFPVFFQCKRYRKSVRAPEVRDFRGAMAGRGDKGLLITTSSFTQQARDEATRDGTKPIDLIDGEQLCDLIKQHGLGVETRVRQVEDVSVDRTYFEKL
ncbi:restriction endonuclease [Streptomyces sp. NEAU-L66]|uniref:restriction endonuclease n=1 Tax=Streptomyces sp. NEAU-L66 TaxID=3390812 RepID=UPI0039C672D8